MDRRRLFCYRTPWGIMLLLALLLALIGCTTAPSSTPGGAAGPAVTPAPPGPATVVAGDRALKDAQKEFDDASKLLAPAGAAAKTSTEAQAKYRRVVEIVENQVLPQVGRDDLKVTAYALAAFAKWQLGDNNGAINTADMGKKLCRGAAMNPRDCAMLQMDAGLVVASQTYTKYRNAPTLSQEEVRNFANRMDAALKEIDEVNRMGSTLDPITLYANQWQLMIIREVANVWYTYFSRDAAVWKPEVLKWLRRADQVMSKFPETPYPHQDLTLKLKEEFQRLKMKAEAPA